jgi:hypothetical protein
MMGQRRYFGSTFCTITVLCFACLPAFAQNTLPTQPLTLQAELSKLAGDAQLLQHDLPSITCKETVLSQLMKKSTIAQEVRLVAEVRVERNRSGDLTEHYDFQELNGSPYSGLQPKTPFFVEGAVAEGILFFLPSAQSFFVFTLSPGRIDYSFKKDASGPQPFGIPPSTHGFVLLDDEGNITHIERRADPKEAHRVRVTDFASYDFTPAEMNGKTYFLSTFNVAEDQQGNDTRRFQATISGCHLFHATTTILPGTSVISNEPPSPNPRP